MIAPGAALLSPRGKVLENGMPRFFRRLAEGVFDEDDVRRRADELADFIAEARERYGLPAPIAVGYSNGANIAAAVLLLRPEALAGAVLLRPMMPLRTRSGRRAGRQAGAAAVGRHGPDRLGGQHGAACLRAWRSRRRCRASRAARRPRAVAGRHRRCTRLARLHRSQTGGRHRVVGRLGQAERRPNTFCRDLGWVIADA